MRNYAGNSVAGVIAVIVITALVITACQRTSSSSAGGIQPQTAIVHPEPSIDPRIPQNISAVIQKHFKAIEDGDLTAFRSTLKEPEDGSDINYQLSLICKYFGELFNTDMASFYEAIADGGNELDRIRQAAFSGVFPARNRNTGMYLQELKMDSDFILVRAFNQWDEEFVYHITISGGLIDRHEEMPIAGFDPSGLIDSSDNEVYYRELPTQFPAEGELPAQNDSSAAALIHTWKYESGSHLLFFQSNTTFELIPDGSVKVYHVNQDGSYNRINEGTWKIANGSRSETSSSNLFIEGEKDLGGGTPTYSFTINITGDILTITDHIGSTAVFRRQAFAG